MDSSFRAGGNLERRINSKCCNCREIPSFPRRRDVVRGMTAGFKGYDGFVIPRRRNPDIQFKSNLSGMTEALETGFPLSWE